MVEDTDHKGPDFAVRYYDPPHSGSVIPYTVVFAELEYFLFLAGSHIVVDGPKAQEMPTAVAKDRAFCLLWHAANRARDQRGPDYARGFVGRLHEHRWAPGSRMAGYLLIQAEGGLGRGFIDRTSDAKYVMARVTGLKARIDQVRNEVTNLTEWTEALYRLNPEVQEVMAYLERSELKHTKDWHRYFAQVDEDIMSVHRLNVNAIAWKYQGVVTAPTWITTYLTDLRAGKSAAEYRQQLDHLFQERVTIPKYWHQAALSHYDTAVDSIPAALTEIDPYRALSIDVLESWSLQWWKVFNA